MVPAAAEGYKRRVNCQQKISFYGTELCVDMLGLISLGCAIFGYARARSSSPALLLHEQVNAAPIGFQSQGPAVENTTLSLRIGLKSNNLSGLQAALYAASTPESTRYGQHLSRDDVYSFVRPSVETTEAVTSWLSSYQLNPSTLSPAGDWLQLSLTAGQANDLLDADYHVFTHQTTGKQAVRTLSYSIPASLKAHIGLVHPTVK
jgi:tripeptidyl-peptidase I